MTPGRAALVNLPAGHLDAANVPSDWQRLAAIPDVPAAAGAA